MVLILEIAIIAPQTTLSIELRHRIHTNKAKLLLLSNPGVFLFHLLVNIHFVFDKYAEVLGSEAFPLYNENSFCQDVP